LKIKNKTIGKMHLVTTLLFAFTAGMNCSLMMTRAQISGEATDSWSWLLPLLNLVGAVIFATLAYKFLTKPEEN